jgi:hypothetical protein
MRGRVTRSEWRWVLIWIVVALIVTSVPYVVGWLRSTPDRIFGGLTIAIEDGYSYLANMKQGATGLWLFQLPYTSEPHTPTVFYLFYLLLGKVSALTGLSTPLVYHLARLFFDVILLIVIYRFIATFTAWRPVRRIAFLLIVFSGGLGWLLLLTGQGSWLGSLPVDLYLPEGFAFLILYAFPHLALAQALMLLGFICLWRPHAAWRWRDTIYAGVSWLVMGFIVPFFVVVVGTVALTALIATSWQHRRIPWREVQAYLVAGLIVAPIAVYSFVMFSLDPILAMWAAQNIVLSPHPLHYVLGYALLGTLAVVGIIAARRHKLIDVRLLSWLIVVPFLVYIPFSLQRRLIEGWQIVLAFYAAIGLVYVVLPAWRRSRLVRRLTQHRRYTRHGLTTWFLASVLFVSAATYAVMLVDQTLRMVAQQPPSFRAGGEIAALRWLDARVTYDDVILSSYNTGNFLPTMVGARAFLGHGPETAYSDEKRQLVQQFYAADTPDEWRREFLRQWPITHVFFGPLEQQVGSFNPAQADYLKLEYDQGGYRIYQVVKPNT